ncbi:MAG TPA: hypothetical protein VIM99_04200, partial [Blastocatellia bacterium]
MSEGALIVIQPSGQAFGQASGQLSGGRAPVALAPHEKSADGKSENLSRQEEVSVEEPKAGSNARQNEPQTAQPERRTFWERVFRMQPLRKRLEKALVENWKFSEVRPRHIEELLS